MAVLFDWKGSGKMRQTLYWLEPEEKWRSRGYANNVSLEINYDDKTYKYEKGMIYPSHSNRNIRVATKESLKLYVDCLINNGFKEDLT